MIYLSYRVSYSPRDKNFLASNIELWQDWGPSQTTMCPVSFISQWATSPFRRGLAVVHNAVQRCSDGSSVPKDTDKNKSITVTFHAWEPIKCLSWQNPLKLLYRELTVTQKIFWESHHICHPWNLALGLFPLQVGRSLTSLGCLPPWSGMAASLFTPSLSLPLSLFILSWNPNCYLYQVCLVDPREGQSPFRKRLDPI